MEYTKMVLYSSGKHHPAMDKYPAILDKYINMEERRAFLDTVLASLAGVQGLDLYISGPLTPEMIGIFNICMFKRKPIRLWCYDSAVKKYTQTTVPEFYRAQKGEK